MVWFGRVLDSTSAVPGQRQAGAKFALLVLTTINLLNFADRYVTSAVKELIKSDLQLSDAETALPTTGMVVVYVISACVFGVIGDMQLVDRRFILAVAIAFWSLATASAGLAQNLEQLVILRSLVGVGEAAYSTIAPPMISDFFPSRDRNIAYSIYFLAMPVGGAVGFGVGAVLGSAFGWRIALLGVGLPGVVASVCVLMCNNPAHGLNDIEYLNASHKVHGVEIGTPSVFFGDIKEGYVNMISTPDDGFDGELSSHFPLHSQNGPATGATQFPPPNTELTRSPRLSWYYLKRDVTEICLNKLYVTATAGTVANTFAVGGLAEWFPAYMTRFHDVSVGESGLVVGIATILGGIGGCIIGAKTSQYLDGKVKSAYFSVPAAYTVPSAIFLFLLLNASPEHMVYLAYAFLFLAEVFVWTNMAPISTIAISSIHPKLRATSCGLSIVLQHVLGDMISPLIIGGISDTTGSLRTGLQVCWIMTLVSGAFWWAGYRFLPALRMHSKPRTVSQSEYFERQTTFRDILFADDAEFWKPCAIT